MATAATSLLGLALPVTGELSGTWGDTVNTSITALLDSAVAGTTTLSVDADVTLTTTALAANQAREAIILWTAGGTVTRNITAPAQSKTYVVLNKTSSTQSIVIRGVGPTTGVTVLAGRQAMVAWDGTDYVEVSSGYVDGPASATDNAVARFDGTSGKTIQNSVVIIADTTGNMTGVGTLSSGAITSSSLTATRVLFAGTSGLIQGDADLTFNGTILTSTGFAGPLNGTVGATTANTGNFTTLTTSSTVTLNGGTPNGVTYLNASKVLTSGTALTFDGTNLGLGGGLFTASKTQTGLYALRVFNGSNVAGGDGAGIQFGVSSAAIYGRIWTDNNSAAMYFDNLLSTPFIWRTGGTTEGMRLTSTGLGIGTSSPTSTLSVTGTANVTGNVTLGDASTDAVTVNGYMGVGVAANTSTGVLVQSTALLGVDQRGGHFDPTGTSSATSQIVGVWARGKTAAAVFTTVDLKAINAADATKGAGSTITNQHGVWITDQTQGTNNYGITSLVSSGTNKWNVYASGTAANFFAGNVLIGDASPSAATNALLSVGKATSSETDPLVHVFDSSDDLGLKMWQADSPDRTFNVKIATSDSANGSLAFGAQSSTSSLRFSTGTSVTYAERMRLDAAGNLGLGVIPSAWGTSITNAIQIRNGAVWSDVRTPQAGNTSIGGNTYQDGTNYRYIASNAAGHMAIAANNGGQFAWFQAPSGTAGNVITFTQAMTLDASGNLGIGITAPLKRLDVNAQTSINDAYNPAIAVGIGGVSAGQGGVIGSRTLSGNPTQGMYLHSANTTTISAGQTIRFNVGTLPATASDLSTQVMTLDASGNLGIGTTTPTNTLSVAGNANVTGNVTLGDAVADTITINSKFVTGTVLRAAQVATNTLALAAYDTDGVAYVNLITLTSSTTPTLALTSTGVGTINNMSIGATTASTGAFTTLSANSTVTFSGTTTNLALGTSQTTGTWIGGGTAQTGAITLGQSTVSQTLNIGTGATTAVSTKAINIGTAGVSGATINITSGSATSGALVTHSWNAGVNNMRLNSAGNLGIGITLPAAKLQVSGNVILSDVDVINATYSGTSYSVISQDNTPCGVFFRPDGLRLFVMGNGTDRVLEYSLSTPWLVSSATYVAQLDVTVLDTSPQDIYFRADGLKLYVIGQTNSSIYQYSLSTPWSITTASYDSISISVIAQDTAPKALWFKPNGLVMFVTGASNDSIYQYNLTTAWNVSTAVYLQSLAVTAQDSLPNGVTFTEDGSRMFMLGASDDEANVYQLTTPWNIATATFINRISLAAQDTNPLGFYIKPDGTKMYVAGSLNSSIYEYNVPSISIQLTGPTAIADATVSQNLTVYGASVLSGNVGIGTSSPTVKLDVQGATRTYGIAAFDGATYAAQDFKAAGVHKGYVATANAVIGGGSVNDLTVDASTGNLILATTDTERARIDSSGNLLVGGTTQRDTAKITCETSTNGISVYVVPNTSAVDFAVFRANAGALCGNIARVGTTNAVTYASASDYRLKENVMPMVGALSAVAQLKPVTYTWKDGGGVADGFIAHELAGVCPSAVVGEKDAVDAEGNPKYQSIDTSFLVATLTAAIQEQQALIVSLTQRLTALESK